LLTVDLVREVPEEMKPRRIQIAGADGQKTIEHDKAA
jgi:molecular chaperone IbpA